MNRKETALWLWSFVRPIRWSLLLTVVLMLCQSVVTLGTIAVQKWIVDDIFVQGEYDKLTGIILVFIAAFVTFSILYVVVAYFLFRNRSLTQQYIGRKLMAHYQSMPIEDYHRQRVGSFIHSISEDANGMAGILTHQSTRGVQHIFYLIMLFFVLGAMSPVILVASFSLAILYTYLGRKMSVKLKKVSKELSERRSRLAVTMEEGISATREVIAYDREEWERGQFNKFFSAYYEKVMEEGRLTNKMLLSSEPFKWGIHLAILGVGGYGVIQDAISLGTFVVVYQFTGQLMNSIQNLFNFAMEWSRGMASAERVRDVLQGRTVEKGHAALEGPIRSIRFHNVRFAYSSEKGEARPVLSGVDAELPIGCKIAIVGASGGGKSTIAQLLLRFYEPDEGAIVVNGVDLRELDRDDWHRRAAIVFQEPYLFPNMVRYNLLMGHEGFGEEEWIRAYRAAQIHDDIVRLPDGYETVLGERGISLSGGQRQRLALARALLRDPELLILDEATSALDLETERQVQHQLDTLRRGKTTIIIAHRLSTVQNADLILVMDQGRLVESGTHEELMLQQGVYRKLVLKQSESKAETAVS